MLRINERKDSRLARRRRIRAKISGTATRPRLAIFRSLRSFSVQAINDEKGTTLASVFTRELKGEKGKGKNTVAQAGKLGELLAERLEKLKVSAAVLDRAGYRYHGKVKAFTEALRERGIKI